MELYKKKDMLRVVTALAEANDTLCKESKPNSADTAELLTECQESAILLGNALEDKYLTANREKTERLVKVLEDYCENIYRLSSGLLDRGERGKLFKKIRRQLSRLNEGIRCDLPSDRMEVVFLPYKASMWDCLESVWKAADEDEDCDAYVVPIPYYDKNADGSFGEEHDEGDLYPEYVPVTRYDEYDFAERKPDMIFIHNPYDECNYVTSVHPFFYSKNLKRFTDQLVYIPYFVLNEIGPEDEAGMKWMENFCLVPGVLNADKVIVQSENMRQIYIHVLVKACGGTKEVRRHWEERIEGIGSPKFDKVAGTGEKYAEIPDGWLKLMRKDDGSLKKVVLYNTSVGALLQHNDEMLRKMESVFEVFCGLRDEMTLLWRPHPLIDATISSMRPQLWEEYRKLADRYKGEGWGIYDDTPDLDRAIAVSDAYYGDGSSLVQLYEKTGKPIMMQNVECAVNERSRRLRFLDFLDDGGRLWFCALYTNGLFCFDKASGKTRLACSLPAETVREAYRGLCLKDGKLYIAPLYAKDIVVFDIAGQTSERLPLLVDSAEYRRMPPESTANFNKMYAFGQYIFFVPLSFGAIVRLDTETNQVDYVDDFVRLLQPAVHNRNAFWFSHSCVVNDKIYMPSSCANALVEFDMKSCTSVVHRLGDEEDSYSMICHDGDDFWILDYQGDSVIVWNEERGIADRTKLSSAGRYNFIFPYGEGIVRVPCRGDLTCDWISRRDHQDVSAIKLRAEKSDRWSVSDVFEANNAALSVKIRDEKIYVYAAQRDSLCVFDQTGKCIQEYILEADDGDKRYVQALAKRLERLAEENGKNPLFREGFWENLPCFLGYVSGAGGNRPAEAGEPQDYGRKIYKKLKEKVIYG